MPENIAEHSASISNPKSRLIVKQVKIILLSFQKKTRETTFKKKKGLNYSNLSKTIGSKSNP